MVCFFHALGQTTLRHRQIFPEGMYGIVPGSSYIAPRYYSLTSTAAVAWVHQREKPVSSKASNLKVTPIFVALCISTVGVVWATSYNMPILRVNVRTTATCRRPPVVFQKRRSLVAYIALA